MYGCIWAVCAFVKISLKHRHTWYVKCYFAIFLYVNMCCYLYNYFYSALFSFYETDVITAVFHYSEHLPVYCPFVMHSGTFGATDRCDDICFSKDLVFRRFPHKTVPSLCNVKAVFIVFASFRVDVALNVSVLITTPCVKKSATSYYFLSHSFFLLIVFKWPSV